ncbi:MAG: BNR-4 repeat-containing protein [Thermoguttaceae bacterium]
MIYRSISIRWSTIVILTITLSSFSTSAYADAPFVTWSDVGWGYGANGINTGYRNSALMTVDNYQFISYYEPVFGQYDGAVVIGRRELGTDNWQTFRTSFHANRIIDAHDNIGFGIDGDGIMHISWGMHGDPPETFHYAKTTASVVNDNPITFGSDLGAPGMTGSETAVTYPRFYSLASGDLFYLFRTGGSGNGDTVLNRYSTDTQTWTRIQNPLIDNYGYGYPTVSAYTQNLVTDSQGTIHLAWCWRTGPDSTVPNYHSGGSHPNYSDYQTNHNICYAKSTDEGATWQRTDGTPYSLPIEEAMFPPNRNAEVVVPIPEGSSLINTSGGMTVDNNDRPLLATWWAPNSDPSLGDNSDDTRQYMLVYYDGSQWKTSQITNRPHENIQWESGAVASMGRPITLVDKDNRVLVLMRYQGNDNKVTVAYSSDRENWEFLDLITDNAGSLDSPMYDPVRWERDGVLDLFYQPISGTLISMVSVVEWDERAYFASVPEPSTLMLLAVGALCSAIFLRRRR